MDILYQDHTTIAVNKPSGLLVHRSSESADRVFLLQELRNLMGRHIYPVHRLDRAASGAILFGLSGEAAAVLQAGLSSPDACKEYLVFVHGKPDETGVIDRPLKNEAGLSKPAHTEFERLATSSSGSLLRVRIRTGRRHQIRRHFAHLGHHLLGDTVYGKGRINRPARETLGLTRLFLHCTRINIPFPDNQKRLEVRSPLPPELREFLNRVGITHPEATAHG